MKSQDMGTEAVASFLICTKGKIIISALQSPGDDEMNIKIVKHFQYMVIW